jgi:hypothetical protein
MYKWTLEEIENLTHDALAALDIDCDTRGAPPDQDCKLAVLNTLPWDRHHVAPANMTQSQDCGNDSQSIGACEVPAFGLGLVTPNLANMSESGGVVITQIGPNEFTMRNSHIALTIEGHLITSCVDLTADRPLLSPGDALNRLVLFDDRPPGA